MKKIRQKHDYTSELELKSLLIRIKNQRADIGTEKHNAKINKYILWHTKINNKKYKDDIAKKNITKNKLKEKVVKLSEETMIDTISYEKFGNIILLMIKRILTKPQFSGYTYKDDFYSDAIYKILKYLHNFDHTMISERSGLIVNSFAYISQIIHNSVLYIINIKKKEQENIKKQVSMEILDHNYDIKDYNKINASEFNHDEHTTKIQETIILEKISGTLVQELRKINSENKTYITVVYPSDYRISFEEFDLLKPILKNKFSIIRSTNV